MHPVTHQTVRLSRGKHISPEDGACVMELASMLAGESFTDHPHAVCPAIGSLLRAYNDSVDDDRRQDLYRYAARIVGSRRGADAERVRAERMLDWAAERHPRRWTGLLPAGLRQRFSRRRLAPDAAGTHAVYAIRRHTRGTHAAVLALLEELLAIGVRAGAHQASATVRPAPADSYSASIARACPTASSRPSSGAASPRIAADRFSASSR
jgi:hypothetical protein